MLGFSILKGYNIFMTICNVRKWLQIFLISFALFGIAARVFCYQAEVTDISGNKYFPAVKEALARAEKSIYLVMFTITKNNQRRGGSAKRIVA